MLSQHEGLLYVNGKLGMGNVITLSRMNQSWREGNFDLKYFWAAFVAITALATSLMNALVVGAICKDPSRNLKTVPSNLLIASQAIADFFVGLIHEPLCSWWILTFSSTAAHVIEAVSSLFLVASVLHVVALSFDRYIAVWRPLSHPSVVTKKKVVIWCIVIWSYSFIYMAYRTVLREVNHPIVIINILSGTHTILPSFISVIFYVRIYFALRNNRKRACVLDDSGQIVANAYRRERNMTKAMMAVLGLFLLCITPWFLLYQVIGACPTCSEHTSVEMYLFAIFYYIFLLKSLLNPFLYAWRLPKFRSAFKIMIKTSRISRTDRIGTMTN